MGMKQQELNTKMVALTKSITQSGFEKAQKEVPYFTEMLFVWAGQNKYEEALTEFLACFVEGAMTKSMEMLSRDLLSVSNAAKRAARKKKRAEGAEKKKEGGSDE